MTDPQEARARVGRSGSHPARVFTLGDLPLADATSASWENALL
jgi:hypothetical protein